MNANDHLIPRKFLWIFVICGFIVSVLWMQYDLSQESYEERVHMSNEIRSLKR